MADAELIITPELSRAAMMKTMADLNRNMNRAAKMAEKDFEKHLSDGMEKGAQKGSSKMSGILRSAKFGIAGLVAAGATMVVAQALNRARTGTDLIAGTLEEGTATATVNAANTSGVELGRFVSTQQDLIQGGADPETANSILFELNALRGEAIANDEGILRQFADVDGDQFYQTLGRAFEAMTPDQRVFQANEMFGEDGQAFLNAIQNGDFGAREDGIDERVQEIRDLAMAEDEYRKFQLKAQQETRDTVSETLKTEQGRENFYAVQELDQDGLLGNLNNYSANTLLLIAKMTTEQEIANTANDAMSKAAKAMDNLVKAIKEEGFNKAVDEPLKAALGLDPYTEAKREVIQARTAPNSTNPITRF